jgi:hypothetical protein
MQVPVHPATCSALLFSMPPLQQPGVNACFQTRVLLLSQQLEAHPEAQQITTQR